MIEVGCGQGLVICFRPCQAAVPPKKKLSSKLPLSFPCCALLLLRHGETKECWLVIGSNPDLWPKYLLGQ